MNLWKITGLAVIVAVASVGSFALWLFFIQALPHKPDSYAGSTTPHTVLSQKNQAYKEGIVLYRVGKYAEALQQFKRALENANDVEQEGQIRSYVAVTLEQMENYPDAIAEFKKIAVGENYQDLVRASAVQKLGLLLLRPETASYRKLIYSTEPYASMAADDSWALADRRLFEYAASLYPLAVSEIYSANWYADVLVEGDVSSTTRSEYIDIINEKISLADADLERIKNDENESGYTPNVLQRKAQLIGKLVLLGQRPAVEADTAYQKAMVAALALGPGEDGYVRYYYALFLESQGEKRHSDLLTTLNAYSRDDYRSSSVFSFFAGEKANAMQNKSLIAMLARSSTDFRNLLVSLGWRDVDFSI